MAAIERDRVSSAHAPGGRKRNNRTIFRQVGAAFGALVISGLCLKARKVALNGSPDTSVACAR
jgi:hypothetical protein